jgi:hypothetical protein
MHDENKARDDAKELPAARARLVWTGLGVTLVLCASWMGAASGGYFTEVWAPATLSLGVLAFLAALAGVLRVPRSRLSIAAVALFTAYAAWSLASVWWAPNRGDAWTGAGLTLMYVLVFVLTIAFVGRGARRRWILTASAVGPALVAAFTLSSLTTRSGSLFDANIPSNVGRLSGTVGYYNAEAAFLLVPLWAAVYAAGSRRIHPIVRGVVLAGTIVSVAVAVMAQSRGAMLALALSLPVFFVLSGQRLRGLLALVPVALFLLVSFPDLNGVYVALTQDGPPPALDQVVGRVWLAAAATGLYGLAWGLIDAWWEPPRSLVRIVGGVALAAVIVSIAVSTVTFTNTVGSPLAWTEQKWEAFKANDASGQEQSRYLSASGSGRYDLWQVAWRDFASNPVLGVGTHNYEATYYKLRESTVGWVRQPHSLPLEIVAERGIVGGLLFFGALGACLAAGLRSRLGRLGSEGRTQAGAMMACVAYWFVHSSAEWFWQIPAVTLPAVVYLAVLATPWWRPETGLLRWPARAGLAAAAVLAFVAVAPLYASQLYLDRSEAASNPWLAIQQVERAQTVNPVDPRLPQREAELRTQIGDWPRAVDAYERAISLNPEHYAPRFLLARFYESHGEPERALTLYREASNLNPLDSEVRAHEKALESD